MQVLAHNTQEEKRKKKKHIIHIDVSKAARTSTIYAHFVYLNLFPNEKSFLFFAYNL